MFRGDSYLESDKIRKQQEAQEKLETERRIREAQGAAGSAERHFTDRKGRDMTLRTEGAELHKIQQIEAQDTQTIRHPIRLRTYHESREVGRTNLTLEADKVYNPSTAHYDRVAYRRLRINDIETYPAYRGSEVGSEHIREAERFARQHRASEVYGSLSYKPEDEAAVRSFYRKHGYETRPGAISGADTLLSINKLDFGVNG